MAVTGQPRIRRQGVALVLALLAALVALVAPAGADGNEAPGDPPAFRSITAGGVHTCAILDDATVKCWGYNSSGQLGQGDVAARGDAPNEMGDALPAVDLGTGRTATALAAGYNHTCALLDNGTVKCWGDYIFGVLGLGDTTARGDAPGEMGDALPAVDLGTGRTATAITAGDSHTCALLDNNTVKCWGTGGPGQLGLGDTANRGDNAGEMGDALPTVDLGTGRTATAITAGAGHTCALLDNNTVKCWGYNSNGQLGLGENPGRGANGGEMGDNLPAVDLGTGRTATALTAGSIHTCALLDNATVKCWGFNGIGELGLGDTTQRGSAPSEMGDNLPPVDLGTGRTATALTAGGDHSCASLDNATVKCWGYNSNGQLGVGDAAARGAAPGQMGDALPAAIILDADGVIRPDGRIRRATTFAGNNIYNTNAVGQTRAATVPRLGTATFTARIQNDGDVWDTFTLRGQATTTRYRVVYRSGPTDITAQVTAGTYTIANLAPGATRDITIRITARLGTPVGNTINRTLVTRSTNSPTTRDTVKATVTRR